MMDENPWLVEHFNHGFPFWVYAAFCVVLVVVMWRAVPETKGKSLEEIEQHWRHRGTVPLSRDKRLVLATHKAIVTH